MGSAYKYKAANAAVSVNNLVAIKTDILNQMNNRTFTLADLGFTDTDTTTYMSSATTVNGGTWGKALTLPFYYSEAVQTVPFTDPKTVPNPHLVYESSTKKYQRSFPTSTKTTGNSTSVYIDLSNFGTSTALQISYNASTGYITAKAGSTTYLNTKASPCIYVDAQAAGGKGGKGAYVYRTILLDWGMAVAGGGGGGSGAFASLSTDLSQSSLSIYKLSNGGVEIYDSESNYRLFLSSGKDGGAGTTRDQDTGDGITSMGIDFKGTGGAGGNGGNVSVLTSMGDTVSTGTNVRRTALGKSYIIDVIVGAAGAAGGGTQANYSTEGRVNGSTGSTPVRTIYLTSNTNSLTQCVKYGTTSQTSGGQGELWDDTKPKALAGGGGGGASIMSDGGSWGKTTAIGAGGPGQSGWTDMDTYDTPAGGGCGVWISYIPI